MLSGCRSMPDEMCFRVTIVLSVMLAMLSDRAASFNIDTHNYVKHRGNPNSMFGFSVALHRENSNSWLIVGAPTAQTSQPGVERGGAVYRCNISTNDTCSRIEFDVKGNINDSDGKQVDMKSNQWFGATVKSSGEDGIILACAPRYTWSTTTQTRRDPVGTCYVAKNQFSEFAEYSPCRTRNWGYHRQGSCQAGLGASVSRDGRRLYIGAPGSWYWQGQVHSVDAYARLPFIPPRFTIIEEGQVISQSTHARPDVLSTREGPSTDDDSYLGYSVAVGEFGGGSGDFNDVAVGMPRGEGLVGKVVLYNWNMTNLKNFTGHQLGAYFGYSLAVCDVDGDKRDDILVGAPLYTDLDDNKGYYETGRVYILYQGVSSDYRWNKADFLDGVNSKSRFGLALSSLGDLNLDGFQDFAVGAPYDGPNERGAVYIYLGSEGGVREKPSQIVYSEQVDGELSTFGFSLAGGLDLDENLYPDLLIGAYDSSTAVFLRTRPAVSVDASLVFLLPSKQISLEEKNCSLKDRTKVPCVELNTCLNYTGINVDNRLEFEIQFILDSKLPHSPRMFFISEENRNVMSQTIRLDKNNKFCKKTTVYIKPNVRDKLTSLEAEMKYSLRVSESSRRGSRHLHPVLDRSKQEEMSKRDIILIQKDCGKDNVCIPNLRLIATPSVNKYLLGSGERLELDVVVQNEGEDAFEAIYELQVPSGLNYVKIEKAESAGKELMPVLCSPPSYSNNNTLHCDIGNPLPKEKIVHFKVILQPRRQDGLKPRYEFFMYVNSTNPESSSTTSDNQMHFKVPIWVETDLILQGSSHPSEVHYNVSQYQSVDNITQESDIGPQILHTYIIRNKGPSDILEAEAFFLWPSYTLAGEHLFYLLEQPDVSGPVRCEFVEDVNIEKVNMEKRRQNQYEAGLASAVHSSLTGSERVSGSSSSRVSSSSSSSSWSSSGSHSSGGSWRGQGTLSAEEKRRLEEAARRREEDIRTSGSSSQGERWRQSQQGSSSGSGRVDDGDHRYWRNQSSWSSSASSGRGGATSGGGRAEASRTEQGASWNSGGYGFNSDLGSSGGMGMDREVIIDTRGSNIGSDRWTSGGSRIDVGSRLPDGSRHGSWYNETRSGHRSSSSAVGSGERVGGSGSRGTVIRVDETSNRGRQPSTDSHFEERHYERNATWDSSGRRPHVSTSWSVNRDGTVDGGSYQGEGESSATLPENKDESYFGHRDRSFNDTWMVSESNMNRGMSGGRYDGTRRYEDRPTGSSRNYSEERTSSRNTSWTSQGGPPVTSEHSSWSVTQDGHTKNGSQSRVFHEKDSYGRDKFVSTQQGSQDRNSIGSGESSIYKEEREMHKNTTWSSSGGVPKTEETNRWKIEKDGVVTSGGSSRTYESGVSSGSDLSSHREGHGGSFYSSGGRISSSEDKEYESSGREQGSRTTSYDGTSSRGGSHTSWTASGERREHHQGRGSSQGESRSSTSQSSREEHESGMTSQGSGSHIATNTNIGDLLKSRRRNDGFGGLGDIAVGPKDGAARTYTMDLGILNSGDSEKTSSSHRSESTYGNSGSGYSSGDYGSSRSYSSDSSGTHSSGGSGSYGSDGSESYSSSGRRTYSSGGSGGYSSSGSRHYEFGSSGDSGLGSSVRTENRYSSGRGGSGFSATRNEDDGGYSGSSGSYHRGSSSGGSRSWSYSSTSGTADGDSSLNGGMYSQRQEHSSSSQSSHYGPRSRRQVDDFDESLECSSTKCTKVRCTVGPLKKDEEGVIKFKSRVWVHTLKKLAGWNQVNVSSMLVARVSRLPHIGRPDVATTRNLEVLTQLVPRHPPPKPEVVPLWIIVLSACAGALLLMLLVLILYKLGFFKRNRPSNSPEKQPLNRNGHYPGDEAL